MRRFVEKYWTWGLAILVVVFLGVWERTGPTLGVHISPLWALGVVAVLAVMTVLVFQAVAFAFTNRDDRRRRLALFESDCGRKTGWYVEYEGRPIAVLTDPRYEDMFWVSYHIEALAWIAHRFSPSEATPIYYLWCSKYGVPLFGGLPRYLSFSVLRATTAAQGRWARTADVAAAWAACVGGDRSREQMGFDGRCGGLPELP
jgi:hypothetical protein